VPDDGSESRVQVRPAGRLEAFADGVFAIAMTLLALEIPLPDLDEGESLLEGLLAQWPAYLAYAISFFTLGAVWLSHYAVTHLLRGVDEVFLRLNLLLLFFVALLPFPTLLIAEFLTDLGRERVAVTVYTLTFMAISVVLRILWGHAAIGRLLLRDDVTAEQIKARNARLTPLLGLYGVAVPVGLAFPHAAVAMLVLAILYQALPHRAILRVVRADRPQRD